MNPKLANPYLSGNMDSQDLISGNSLQFTLDTESLPNDVDKTSPLYKLLKYKWRDDFRFVRSPSHGVNPPIANIPAYDETRSPTDDWVAISIEYESRQVSTGYHKSVPQNRLLGISKETTEIGIEQIELLESFKALSTFDDVANIVITSNDDLLEHRRILEYQIGRQRRPVSILTPYEAAEVAGVFMRSKNDYEFYLSHERKGRHTVDLPMWCWAIDRLLIQYIDMSEHLASLLDRIDALILGIDRIAEQQLRGTGNHTDIEIRYHFNYCIALLTGIGDVLALQLRDELAANIKDDKTTIRTGGRPLLKELRDVDHDSWLYIQENHHFIEILHIIRNDIIHQSGVISRGPGFSLREGDSYREWNSHAFSLDNLEESGRHDFTNYYQHIDDKLLPYDPMTEWGVITHDGSTPQISEYTLIDAYQFIKKATLTMVRFVDELLRLRGHHNRLLNGQKNPLVPEMTLEIVLTHGLHPILDAVETDGVPLDLELYDEW